MNTLNEVTIQEIIARSITDAVNQVSGFQASVESSSKSYAQVEVEGPIRNSKLTTNRSSLVIQISEDYISLDLVPDQFTEEELSSPLEAMDALANELRAAVQTRFELVDPACFPQLVDALVDLGLTGLPDIE